MTKPRGDGWTEMGGEAPQFPMTSMSVLRGARERGSPEYRAALQRLVADYWKPIYCLVRRAWGKSNEEAKDLTQEFLTEMVLEGPLIERFDPERGSFRAFLKTAVLNFLRNDDRDSGRQKRGGGAEIVSLQMDGFELEELIPDASLLTPEQAFESAWKQTILTRALESLELRLKEQGREEFFEVFKRLDLVPEADRPSYRAVGEALGMNVDKVKNCLSRARFEFRAVLRERVSDYAGGDREVWNEMKELFGL